MNHASGLPALGTHGRIVVGAESHPIRSVFCFADATDMDENPILRVGRAIAHIQPPVGDPKAAAGWDARRVEPQLQQAGMESCLRRG
jgi:hypothetical protein